MAEFGGLFSIALSRSDDAGQTWRQILPQRSTSEVFYSLRFSPDGQMGVLVSRAAVYRSSDGGQNWNRDFDYGGAGNWLAIGFAGALKPVLAGGEGQVFVGAGY
jgi:photosystem II stability/assembly factor-like uncharacterized protein